MNIEQKQKTIKAGEIAKKVKIFAKEIIKKGVLLLEIAEKIEDKIYELGGKPAFPINLSMDEIAAHYTPSHNDETKAHGLLKIDIGVHIDGYIADTAFSMDLENSEENQKLILSSKQALENVENKISSNSTLSEIGRIIETTINEKGFNPIINLSGHSIQQYNLHAGISVPNIDNKSNLALNSGIFAIEPFATAGSGKVKDGKPSGIYQVQILRNPRSELAREILNYITEEYNTLPFCSRWLVKKFGTKALAGLNQLEQEGILHNFAQLIEITKAKVSQAENTFLIEKNNVINTTK